LNDAILLVGAELFQLLAKIGELTKIKQRLTYSLAANSNETSSSAKHSITMNG
jgi:hypothetical protein